MLNSLQTLIPGTDASSLHGDGDKPSVSGFNFMEHWLNLENENIKDEEWVDIIGYKGMYQISNKSRFRSLDRAVRTGVYSSINIKGKILKQWKNKDGYWEIRFSKRGIKEGFMSHVLVAKHFVPNPFNYPIVHHIDHNPSNLCKTNLEWTTGKKNMEYASKAGRMCHGEKRPASKLKEKDVIFIYETKMPYRDIAKRFGVCFATIQEIKCGRNWAYLTKNLMKDSKTQWSPEDDYSSHRPALYDAVLNTKGRVVELGCGFGSTPILENYCIDNRRQFISVESNKEWAAKFPNTLFIDDYNKCHIFMPCDVLFIDCAPGELRRELIKKFNDSAQVLVIHDTELGAEYVYGMASILDTFKYRLDYAPEGKPWTTIVSNFIDVTQWIPSSNT